MDKLKASTHIVVWDKNKDDSRSKGKQRCREEGKAGWNLESRDQW